MLASFSQTIAFPLRRPLVCHFPWEAKTERGRALLAPTSLVFCSRLRQELGIPKSLATIGQLQAYLITAVPLGNPPAWLSTS